MIEFKWHQIIRDGKGTRAVVRIYDTTEVPTVDDIGNKRVDYSRTLLKEVEMEYDSDMTDEVLRSSCRKYLAVERPRDEKLSIQSYQVGDKDAPDAKRIEARAESVIR